MIIIKYNGGLGNQMFQYANQIALENRYKNQIIKADLSHYQLWNEHNGYELHKVFNIKLNLAHPKEIRPLTNSYIVSAKLQFLPDAVKHFLAYKYSYWYYRIGNVLKPHKQKTDVRDGLYNEYNPQVEYLKEGSWYIHGVWLNTKYFSEYKEIISVSYSLKCELNQLDAIALEQLRTGKAIAVHVRGGDFNNKYFDLCDKNYYRSALKNFLNNLPIYIFTDDIPFAKNKLAGMNIAGFISHGITESKKDMYMLSMSKYIILSNSTFAFWGAYLNTEKKIVVAPKYARFDGRTYWRFPVEDEWEVIDNRGRM